MRFYELRAFVIMNGWDFCDRITIQKRQEILNRLLGCLCILRGTGSDGILEIKEIVSGRLTQFQLLGIFNNRLTGNILSRTKQYEIVFFSIRQTFQFRFRNRLDLRTAADLCAQAGLFVRGTATKQ